MTHNYDFISWMTCYSLIWPHYYTLCHLNYNCIIWITIMALLSQSWCCCFLPYFFNLINNILFHNYDLTKHFFFFTSFSSWFKKTLCKWRNSANHVLPCSIDNVQLLKMKCHLTAVPGHQLQQANISGFCE